MSNGFELAFKVRKLVFFYAGVAQEQVVRPFQTRFDQGIGQLAMEATNQGTNLTSGAFNAIASTIIQPKGQHEGLALAPNGWQQPRLSFLMEVETVNTYSNVGQVMALSGYTDHVGAVHVNGQDKLDERMRLYFNNCVRMSIIQVPTAQGVGQRLQSRLSEQILRPTLTRNSGTIGNEYTMRPTDVVSAGASAAIEMEANIAVDNYTTGFINEGIKLASRSDMIGANFLSRSVNAWVAATNKSDDLHTHADIASMAAGDLNNLLLEQNRFFSMLSNQFDFNNHEFAGSISYGELCRLDPNTDLLVQVIIPAPPKRQLQVNEVVNSNSWGGSDNETIAANIITQALPTIMSRFMLGRMTFTMTNDTVTGEPAFEWTNLVGFTDGLDVRPHVVAIQHMLVNTILGPISFQGQISASVTVDCWLYANTTIMVSIQGSPVATFVSPTYADQLFSPMFTHNFTTVLEMGSDVVNLANELSSQQFESNYNPGVTSNGIIGGL